MRNAHPRYLCYPSVVLAGEETSVSIYPKDPSRRFFADREYEVGVLGLRDPEESYYEAIDYNVPCYVKDGCLVFTYRFESEQEYLIRFKRKGEHSDKVALYAVERDLYDLRPLKGDLHSHSYYSDGSDGIPLVPADYREEGFDFFALTDHNRMFPSRKIQELYQDVPLGICMIPGEEVHTPESSLHIVHVGGKHSVCEQYILDRDRYEAEVDAIAETLTHVPEYYRRKTAMAHWACQKIKEAEGLSIFAHPFWQPRRYNVSRELLDILFEEKIFDALELLNGIGTKFNNLQVALWQEQRIRGNNIPIVGSSDSHNHDFEVGTFGRRFTVVFAKSNTQDAILEAIRKGYSVAGELPPSSASDVRFYGDLRLVLFAQFLFENYFNETWRLCVGEGILMRRYALGEPVGPILACLKDTVEHFYKQFYGRLPGPVVGPEQAAFLDDCLEKQKTLGPITKGATSTMMSNNARRE